MTLITALPLTTVMALIATILVICLYTMAEELSDIRELRRYLDSEIVRLTHIYHTTEDDIERYMALAQLWNCAYEKSQIKKRSPLSQQKTSTSKNFYELIIQYNRRNVKSEAEDRTYQR